MRALASKRACASLRLSPCVLVQPDGWDRGEREGYGEPRDVTSLSLSKGYGEPRDVTSLSLSKRVGGARKLVPRPAKRYEYTYS